MPRGTDTTRFQAERIYTDNWVITNGKDFWERSNQVVHHFCGFTAILVTTMNQQERANSTICIDIICFVWAVMWLPHLHMNVFLTCLWPREDNQRAGWDIYSGSYCLERTICESHLAFVKDANNYLNENCVCVLWCVWCVWCVYIRSLV